ncbi:hypothetical protein [Nonomuraea zeae]|uniref:DUF8094 domain-containing protein n=1 Tax=Nonomuraea zeae TaxID=1642303 RepID=A0A5S4G998_9ACTN|nr:hypothetical protein [Nonomuraea zeae]TMR29513.1 hypothetical protein ETD85_32195 [Nonomuraea zeae]
MKEAPSPAASSTPKPSAPVTAQETAAVFKDYAERNNAANAALSDKLLAGYEGGSSLAIDKASYASTRKLGGNDDYVPFGYDRPAFHVPAARERWFLTTAYWKGKTETAKEPTYLIFARDGEFWRQMYAPDTYASVDLPEIRTDASGAAAEVGQEDATGLLMSPAAFAEGYAAHLVGQGTPAEKTRFAADKLTTGAASNRRKMDKYARLAEIAHPAAAYPSYALRTADGGALAFTTIERSKRYNVRPGPERNYVFQKDNGLLPGKYYTYMEMEELIQVVAHIPPKSAEPGQIQVLGAYSGIISGSGR